MMRIMLKDSHRIPVAYHRRASSLLPFFVYWPQKVLIFLWSFAFNGLKDAVIQHVLPLSVLIGILLLFNGGSWTAITTPGPHTAWTDFEEGASHWIETITIILVVFTLSVKSYSTVSRQQAKHRITYTRQIDTGEE